MEETKEKEDVRHPEGGILLCDGSVIKGYCKEQMVDEDFDDELQLDTSGRYLSLSKHSNKNIEPLPKEDMEKIFTDNAMFFYLHSDEILADSRLFLAQVPMNNGLYYTGGSGFRSPTLGVYLEWWKSCKEAVVEKDGEKWLIVRIIGSPLSGSNTCTIVNAKGETMKHSAYPFISVWSTFMNINSRYKEPKQKYLAYTIDEARDVLRKMEENSQKNN